MIDKQNQNEHKHKLILPLTNDSICKYENNKNIGDNVINNIDE